MLKSLYCYFSLAFIFLLCNPINSQELRKEKLIEGVITNSLMDLEGMHILNISNHTATISNYTGNFNINAAINDTITISSIQFETAVIKVTDSIYNSQKLEITLMEMVNELEEVVVHRYGLTGDLRTDLRNYKRKEPLNEVSLGLPHADIKPRSKEERELYIASTASSGGVPLGYLIMALNGELKRLKRNINLAQQKQQLSKAENKFDFELLSEKFNIPIDYMSRFFDYCQADANFDAALSKTDFEFYDFLQSKVADFKKDNNLE